MRYRLQTIRQVTQESVVVDRGNTDTRSRGMLSELSMTCALVMYILQVV